MMVGILEGYQTWHEHSVKSVVMSREGGREIVALGSSGGSESDMYTGNYIFITEIHCRGIRIFFHYGYVYVA